MDSSRQPGGTAPTQRRDAEPSPRIDQEEDLDADQRRASWDAYPLPRRTQSCELHGIGWAEQQPADASSEPGDTSPSASADAHADVEAGSGASGAGGAGAHGTKVLELLAPVGAADRLQLEFQQLTVWAPLSPKQPSVLDKAWAAARSCGRPRAPQERQVLHGVSGQVQPGQVLALMGPSGSGKTTLLTLLGGRSPMKFRGTVRVNGEPFTKAMRKRIGFVLQEDVLHENLTVKETLTYAALLRLPGSMSRAQKLARVDTVLDALGLGKSRNTIIGGFFRRGISGGERKRTSIGHELLINPAILLLDEPTSGLDSTTALHLIVLLSDLAAGGRSIATTIHQPSSRLYQKLDRLMLLAEGHLMYAGRADQVLDWFAGFGFALPRGVSTADFILDLSLGEAGVSRSGASGHAAVVELYTAFEAAYARGGAGDDGSKHGSKHGGGAHGRQQQLPPPPPAAAGRGFGGGRPAPLQQRQAALCTEQRLPDAPHAAAQRAQPPRGASYGEQLLVLLQRTAKLRRFEQMTGQNFFQLLAVAFITGMVWWQRGQAYYGGVQAVTDLLGLLFFMLLFPSMRALFRALFTFPNEYRMLLKERPSGMYRLSAYYLARTASDVPGELLNTGLFVVITYWFGGLRHSAAGFFGLLFSLVLVVAVAESWGLLIGGVFMEAKTAQTVTTVLILAFLLVGGYYVRNIPVWISWLRYLSYLYWGFNLLIKSQFTHLTFYSCGPGGACVPVPVSSLSLSVNPDDPAWPDVLILLLMLAVLRVCIYVVLRRKTRVRQRAAKAA